ncbi:hypothetical protein QYE76_045236 [Lolium multiflorum]|uniref:Uncharacterized protein n=1 Tax=Lolium multiflorum TaxID=4521 RepID=A0AAD8TM62_LOLMU|nr:hypothetical protein QYE76_045236 [Lolium multiflorum]
MLRHGVTGYIEMIFIPCSQDRAPTLCSVPLPFRSATPSSNWHLNCSIPSSNWHLNCSISCLSGYGHSPTRRQHAQARVGAVMILISVPDEDNQHHKDDQDMTELVINLLLSSSPYLIVTNPSISVILLLELEVFHIMEGAISSPSNTRVAVVTGGNKGIGFEVCRQLANGGVMVVLTARDETRGREAVEKLKGLGVTGIFFHELEIIDASSISTLADFLKSSFGKLDILVNNAAVGGVEYDQELDTNEEKFGGLDFHQRVEWMLKNAQEPIGAAKKSVQTNYYGTKHVTEALLPLLQSSSDGRIVNVSSDYGLLKVNV